MEINQGKSGYIEKTLLKMTHVSRMEKRKLFRKNDHFILQDISFSLPAGYIMGLAGVNGAGKTTLLDCIMNPKQCYQGEIQLNGRDIREDHTVMREQLGFVSEQNHFLNLRSAKQNAELLGNMYMNFDMKLFFQALQKMELSPSKKVGEMSRGELMRFQMAFAIAHKPALYLLDEVTAGMDPVFRMDFFHILQEIIKDEAASVIMVTHLEEELHKYMDYIGIMEQGRLVEYKENVPA